MTLLLQADAAGIAQAAALLRAGLLVAFGTETVYGLGADATDGAAVARIYAAKQRPEFNPLISHFPSAEAAFAHVVASPLAQRLAAQFWPGPLTLVLPRAPGSSIASLAAAGLETLAVRVPAPAPARALLAAVGRPVAAPSANRSGRISPTSAADVLEELGGAIDAVLDTGPCRVGLESTVLAVDATGITLLRPGGITPEAIAECTGLAPRRAADDPAAPRSPGQLLAHYAPTLPVRLDATAVAPGEGLLAFGPALPGAAICFNLSEAADLTEAAARLFTGLRALDHVLGLAGIAAMPIPARGLGLAIRDRLSRAAASRTG